jgi:hypothetical protein
MFVNGGVCGGYSPCPRRGQGSSSCVLASVVPLTTCLSPGQTWVRADVVFGDVNSQAVGEDVLLLPMEGCAGVDMYGSTAANAVDQWYVLAIILR